MILDTDAVCSENTRSIRSELTVSSMAEHHGFWLRQLPFSSAARKTFLALECHREVVTARIARPAGDEEGAICQSQVDLYPSYFVQYPQTY